MLLLSLTTSAVDFEFAYQACSVIKTASGNETRLPWDQKLREAQRESNMQYI